MAECRFRPRKTSEEDGKVCGQRYSEVTCAFSLIKFLTSIARLKVNQNTRSPSLSENLNLEKRMAFSVLVSSRTVPLHLTLAVNNLGFKFVS